METGSTGPASDDVSEATLRQIIDALSAAAALHKTRYKITIEIEPPGDSGPPENRAPLATRRLSNILPSLVGDPVPTRIAAEPARGGSTVERVISIVASYNLAQDPDGATILGPAVPAMQTFVADVNAEFSKAYVTSNFNSTWSINRASTYIDRH